MLSGPEFLSRIGTRTAMARALSELRPLSKSLCRPPAGIGFSRKNSQSPPSRVAAGAKVP